jgi:hypothetical protein
VRLWARHLADVRERTVFEHHLLAWLAPFWALPRHRAVRTSLGALGRTLRPAFDEGWRDKLARTVRALGHARTSLSQHREQLGDAATRGRGRNPPDEPET